MGIVNVTPDSFSDGVADITPARAIARCEQLLKDGADILDIGGESSRPGALPVSAATELERVRTVLVAAVGLGCPISIDTTKPEVMRAALDLGADIVNDIAALRTPGALAAVASHPDCGVCLMHMRGTPRSMQSLTDYGDVVDEVAVFLRERIDAATAAGIARERIVVDPGRRLRQDTGAKFRAAGAPGRAARPRRAAPRRLVAQVDAGARDRHRFDPARRANAGRAGAARGRQRRRGGPRRAAWRGDRPRPRRRRHQSPRSRSGERQRLPSDNRAAPARNHSMSRTYFGTDGIRGTVGNAPITPDFMLRLGHAVGQVLRQGARRPTVLIGKDTRISGYMIESALEAGFASAGVDVVLTGPLPTPGVAYLTRALRLDLGVVISASHNPFDDNGIKFFSARGEKLPDDWEQDVERAIASEQRWVGSAELGRARRLDDAGGRYIEFCKSTYSNDLTLRGLSIVVDAAHGASYHVAPQVFHELGAEVISIGCRPDGFNINAGFGATAPQALVETVRTSGAAYGIALDGDGDRLQVVDSAGRLYNGDELLYVLAVDRLAHGSPVPGRGRNADDQPRRRAGPARARHRGRAGVGRRSLRARGARQARLAARRRGLGPSARARQAHHRRRHRQRADGAAGGGALGPLARRAARRRRLHTQTLINVRLKAGEDWRANRVLADRRAEIDRQLGSERPGADPAVGHRAGGAGDGRGPGPGAFARLRRAARRSARLTPRRAVARPRARSSGALPPIAPDVTTP